MVNHSKATKARLNNLSKGSANSRRPTVEEVPDSDGDDAEYLPISSGNAIREERGTFFFVEDYSDSGSEPDMDSVSDSDLEERELDDDEEAEINDDIALLTFSLVLRRAQEIAVEAEKSKESNRPKRYQKNSKRTKERWAQKRRKLAAEGCRFVDTFFPQKKKVPEPVSSEPITEMATEIEGNVGVELSEHDCANARVSDGIFDGLRRDSRTI